MTALAALQFTEDLPDGWTPLEAVVVVTALDTDGDVRLHHAATDGLSSCEAIGMLIHTSDVLRQALTEPEDP